MNSKQEQNRYFFIPQFIVLIVYDEITRLIENVAIGDTLGANDHASITCDVLCDFQSSKHQQIMLNFVSIKIYLENNG